MHYTLIGLPWGLVCLLCCLSHVPLCANLYGWWPARVCPWNSPGKNTGVGCHSLLLWIFLTLGTNSHLLPLLYWQNVSYLGSVPWWLSGKESACQCRKWEFDPRE